MNKKQVGEQFLRVLHSKPISKIWFLGMKPPKHPTFDR